MPRLPPPPNREAVELALTAGQRATLAELCRVLGVSPRGWHRLPGFRAFVLAAAASLAAELRAAGATQENAALSAAVRLGLNVDSVKSWLRRGRRESRVQVAPSTSKVNVA
jgi:hypothetical protein